MPHGGYRPGSGRKTNAQINSIRNILNQTMTDADWQELFHRLRELAYDGNMRAAQLLLTYRFGNPFAEPESDAPPINIHTIEARLVERPRRKSAPPSGRPPRANIPGQPEQDPDDEPDEQPDRSPAPIKNARMRYHGDEHDDLMDGL